MYSLIGGLLAPTPFICRLILSQLLGLLVFKLRSSGRGEDGEGEGEEGGGDSEEELESVSASQRRVQLHRQLLLGGAVIFDVNISIWLCGAVITTLNALFREPSPSAPINIYWQQTYAFFAFAAATDVALSFVMLVPLVRAMHSMCCPAWQPQRGAYGYPLRICFVRAGLMPHRHAVRAVKYLGPFCQATVVGGLFYMVGAVCVWLGVWGAWTPGQRCSVSNGLENGQCFEIPGACDPIDPSECLLPFPSSFFMRADTSSFTGYRVRIPTGASIPLNGGGPIAFNLDSINVMDGFSTLAPILFRLGSSQTGERIDAATLRPPAAGDEPWSPQALALSVDPHRSHTLLINAASGEPEPHWVENDVSEDDYPRGTLLVMQPARALAHNAHYIVAVRRVRAERTGELVRPSQAFEAIVGGMGEESRQAVYNEVIFGALQDRMGWMLSEIQLAWDFRTGSWAGGVGRVEHMIRDSRERLSSHATPPEYTIDDVVAETCDDAVAGEHLSRHEGRGREVWGTLSIPSYASAPGPGHELLRILSFGVPICSGNVEQVRFAAYIPCSVLSSNGPAASAGGGGSSSSSSGKGEFADSILQFGHGLLGTRGEGLWELRGRSEETRSLVWAIDWAGMSRFDLVPLFKVLLADMGKFPLVPAQLQQAFTNGACSLWYLKNILRLDPAFSVVASPVPTRRADGAGAGAGAGAGGDLRALISAETPVFFHGISLGAILGAGYVRSSPYISRGILNVGGSPFALILTRSIDFAAFHRLLSMQVTRGTHRRIGMSILQTLWDPAESAGWLEGAGERVALGDERRWGTRGGREGAAGRRSALAAGGQVKCLLLQSGLGDSQVPSVASAVLARSLGAVSIEPIVRPVYGRIVRPRAARPWCLG